MDEDSASFESHYRLGSEQLLGDSSVRDALDDDQAQELLDWGLAQIRAAAEQVSPLPPQEAQALMEQKVLALRQRMHQVNRLLQQIPNDFDRQVVFSHLMEGIARDEEE